MMLNNVFNPLSSSLDFGFLTKESNTVFFSVVKPLFLVPGSS